MCRVVQGVALVVARHGASKITLLSISSTPGSSSYVALGSGL